MKRKYWLQTTLACCFQTVSLLTSVVIAVPSAVPSTGLHLDWINASADKNQNFYAWANSGWNSTHPIPQDYASWGAFQFLDKSNREKIHKLIVEDAKSSSAVNSLPQKIGDFYQSGMDEVTINRLGVQPLQPELNKIENIKTAQELQSELAHLHEIGVPVLFSFGQMQDFKKSTQVIGVLYQAGLALPDRDYYLKNTSKFRTLRKAYAAHVLKMFSLLGDNPRTAAAETKAVVEMETALARMSLSRVEQRDIQAIYHPMTLSQLQKLTPHFSWMDYQKNLHVGPLHKVNMATPSFFKAMDIELQKKSFVQWQAYLRWQLINAYAASLSKPFEDEDFKMTALLTGVRKPLPRWQRVVETENAVLGFAIGADYVHHYFSAKAKQNVVEMLANLRQVLQNDLSTLSWMTPATRQAALQKLAQMQGRMGYPEKIWDYSPLHIDRGPYVLNMLRANQFLTRREWDKIGKPVDRIEWQITPQTVNAYYDPSMNNLNIPAGILQSPFYDPKAPAAVNYGAIGWVMGHEMTHGFDDQGAQFDGHGNLKNWWTPVDLKKFHEATECIVHQFSKYSVDGQAVQGKLVVGEAVADLGGLLLAYRAFHASNAYREAPTLHGYTPDQQFFMAAAHIWINQMRPERQLLLLTTDPHPPARFRVNGTFSNLPMFQEAYSIGNHTSMVNSHRCVIW